MPQGQRTPPEYSNPWIGKSYGNILDEYSNSTYNAKLYIINPNSAPTGQAAQSATTARQSVGAPGNSGSVLTSTPDQTVVIAQTGVTAGNTLDDIVLETAGGSPIGVNFTIKQPNRADLLDQIVLARSFLNCEGTQGVYLYLEIQFMGYTDEDDYFVATGTEDGGQAVKIAGPYRWKILVKNINASMDSGGGTYEFECAFLETTAFQDRRYRLGQNITARGKTITEMVTSVEEGINKFIQSNNDKQVKDIVLFDLSGLVLSASRNNASSASGNPDQNKVLIEVEDLILPDVNTGDTTKAPLNQADANSQKTAEERIRESTQSDANPSEITQEEITNVINFSIGESIQEIMQKILAMCPEARYRYSRKNNPDDIEDQEVNKDQAFIQRLKINAGVEDIGYDQRTNQAAYKIIYRPVLYRSATDQQFVVPEENDNLTPTEVQSRFDQIIDSGNCRKAYQYLFTGLNDQILNLDINFNNAISTLMTPRRGLVGTTDAATAKEKTENVDADEDISPGGLLDSLSKGFEALAKDSISNLFSGDFAGIQGGLDSFVATLEQQGFAPSQLAELQQAIDNGASNELNQFLETIDSATLRNLATNLVINSPNLTSGAPANYSPEQSGYQYSEDFFAVDQTSGIDVSDLNSLGFVNDINRPDSQGQLETTEKDTDTPSKNPVEGVTVDHTKAQANSVFGQVLNQQAAEAFLMNLSLTIRGDPWYLGYDTSQGQSNNTNAAQSSNDSYESSQPEYGYFGTDDNYMFLEIASPRPWDFDYRDEDSLLNTGYWMSTNTSHTFSGLYQMLKVVHNFSGGLYTLDIEAAKIATLDTTKIEQKQV